MFWLALVLQPAFGADQLLGADSVALGGTAVAHPSSQAAITQNPAAMGLQSRYDFGALAGISDGNGLHWGASGVDSQSVDNFAIGFAYTGDLYEPSLTVFDLPGWTDAADEIRNRKRYHDFALALALPMFEHRLSIGLTGNLSLYNHDRQGQGTTGNLHVGLAARPVKWFSLGLAGRNLLPFNEQEDRPATGVAGLRFGDDDIGAFVAEVGYQSEFVPRDGGPISAAGGLEGVINLARIRAGYAYKGPLDTHNLTVGLGLEERGVTLSYGLEIPLISGLAGRDMTHVLSATFQGPGPEQFEPGYLREL